MFKPATTPVNSKNITIDNHCADNVTISSKIIAIICRSKKTMLILDRKNLTELTTLNLPPGEVDYGDNGFFNLDYHN